MNLNVKEIFYSLQGEGGRQGEASIFIRLTRCNLKCTFCDTDFEEGIDMHIGHILSVIKPYPCKWIVWTGGEPTIQLTDYVISFFKNAGYLQAIESNGYSKLSDWLDYTVISPKGNTNYAKKINPQVDEIRMTIQRGDLIPPVETLPAAKYYFLSPIFTDNRASTKMNIDYCIEHIKLHPEWRLSVQIHKLIGMR
jgi:organic radical activating enzyme